MMTVLKHRIELPLTVTGWFIGVQWFDVCFLLGSDIYTVKPALVHP